MTNKDLCQQYLNSLNKGDLNALLALFSADAKIISPLYGERDAQSFYINLFADTAKSETRLLNIFDRSDTGSAIALHFEYNWTLGNGKLVKFECVDVFELTADAQQFQKIRIIYDTAHLRADFNESTR